MRTFEYESLEKAYKPLLKNLLLDGAEISPRGKKTLELSPVCITIKNPRGRVISNRTRKLNYGFMVAELIWMLNGSNDAKFIGHYNKNWLGFSDDGETLNGAYGQRIFKWGPEGINQFEEAYKQLKNDRLSRQATIILFDPTKDYKETKDKPCTNLMRFMIRDNKLNMTIYMRSNDVVKGIVYDVFNFTLMQEIMASKLNVEMGEYVHIVDSFHLYEEDKEWVLDMLKDKSESIYDENYSAIIPGNVDDEIKLISDIEYNTRNNIIDIPSLVTQLNLFTSDYWKSLAAVLIVYNLRKYGYKQDILNIFIEYITNEFKHLLDTNWFKELKRN